MAIMRRKRGSFSLFFLFNFYDRRRMIFEQARKPISSNSKIRA
jgi:hypothetical protein